MSKIDFLVNIMIIRNVPESEYRFQKINYMYYRTHKYEMGGKHIFQCFLSQLFSWVIILYINCGHQGAVINMRGDSKFAITHTLCTLQSGNTYHTFYKIRYLSGVLRICKSSIILSVISPYSVYVVSEILCTVI